MSPIHWISYKPVFLRSLVPESKHQPYIDAGTHINNGDVTTHILPLRNSTDNKIEVGSNRIIKATKPITESLFKEWFLYMVLSA